jgi:hypothetical protein
MPKISTQDDIIKHFPKFREDQLLYFERLIEFTQVQRLALDPGSMKSKAYNLAYISLVGQEQIIDWLISTNAAILNAEFEERVNNKPYDVEAARDELENSKIEINQIEQMF